MAEIMKKRQDKGPDTYEVEGDTLYLVGSQCSECGAAFYPPQVVCARCGSREGESLRLGPQGVVYSWSRVHQSTPEFETPYVLAYVDFPQDVRVLVPLVKGAEPKVGMVVTLGMDQGPRRAADEPGGLAMMVHVRPTDN